MSPTRLKRLRRRLVDLDEIPGTTLIEIDQDERNALVRALTAEICDGWGAQWIARTFAREDRQWIAATSASARRARRKP